MGTIHKEQVERTSIKNYKVILLILTSFGQFSFNVEFQADWQAHEIQKCMICLKQDILGENSLL